MFIELPAAKDLAPLGAKSASGRLPMRINAVSLLRSEGSKKDRPCYKHLAPNGAKSNNALLHL